MPANPEPTEQEIQEALGVADGTRKDIGLPTRVKVILARALRAEREKSRRVEAETWEKAAQESECLFNGEPTRCNESGACAGCIAAARMRGIAAALRSGVREGA